MTVRRVTSILAALILGALTLPTIAQTAPGQQPGTPGQQQGGNNGRQRGQRGQFDPAQARQMMLDRLKQQLGATDDEFQALAPKLEAVMRLQRDVSGRGGRGMRSRNRNRDGQTGQPSQTPQQQLSPVQQAAADLRAVTSNKDAKPEDIKAKLDAYRQARAQAKTQLAGAQQELRGLLTQRQEATLVELGLLE